MRPGWFIAKTSSSRSQLLLQDRPDSCLLRSVRLNFTVAIMLSTEEYFPRIQGFHFHLGQQGLFLFLLCSSFLFPLS